MQLEVTVDRIAMLGFIGLIFFEAFFGRPYWPPLL
jgi:hypothetical protein